jgi:integrase
VGYYCQDDLIQKRLSHSTISTTLYIYSHTIPGLQQQAAQRFDEMMQVSYNDKVVSEIN